MANRKPSSSDFNTGVAVLVRRATVTKKQKGEDSIADPKLRAEFIALKKKAAKKRH